MACPILISVPHGGTDVPPQVQDRIGLSPNALAYFSDPESNLLFNYSSRAAAYSTTTITRLVVDLNRPPYHLPPRHPDGVVKLRTADGTGVWKEGFIPEISLIHRLLMAHYFPYHALLDRLLEERDIIIAFDCHTMVPVGLPGQPDAGRRRPAVCLGNNGDAQGKPRARGLTTCPASWIVSLAGMFRQHFPGEGDVVLNKPFSGGFISNAHYWHKGIPWVQVEVNRGLYELGGSNPRQGVQVDTGRLSWLRGVVWDCLARFGEEVAGL
jgi:formiminoglutamase